jgi:acetyl esterase/lipase
MTVFPPKPATGQAAPVAMFVYGGGWTEGAADPVGQPSPVEAALANRGFFVASINYRLAPKHAWPAQIEDAKCAVRFLRANARKLDIDGSRIGVWGASAGGHLVSLLGLAGRAAGWDVGQYLDQSSAVEAVVDEWGPADLTTTEWSPAVALLIAPKVFGVPFGTASPTLVAASPVTYVHAGAPPFLIIQGVEDQTVHAIQSQEFEHRLVAAGDSARLLMVANAGHGLIHVGVSPVSPPVTQVDQEIVSFFVSHPG